MSIVRAHHSASFAIDLFAGAGGLSLGLQRAGFRVLVANELHPDPIKTYKANNPCTTVVEGDVRRLSGKGLLAVASARAGKRISTGELTLLAGGPPCQGFSMAGLKQFSDPRNSLIAEFLRLVQEVAPEYFLLENVPGLLSLFKGEFFVDIREMLDQIGYDYVCRILQSADYYVPQSRRRVFIVGARDGCAPRIQLPSRSGNESLSMELGAFRRRVTVGEAIGDLPRVSSGGAAHEYDRAPQNAFQTLLRDGSRVLFNHRAARHRRTTVELFSLVPEGGTQRDIRLDPAQGRRSLKKGVQRWNRNDLSKTVTTEPNDFIHYELDRTPTIRELARLQTFPDTYVFLGKRTTGNLDRRAKDCCQSQQVGNAVPVFLACSVGQALHQEKIGR
jgi:DNA (cytosine-5)-methyltransferase 1